MDRTAAVVLAVTGAVMLVFVAVVSVATLAYAASPRMLGDEGEHAVGEAVVAVVFFLSPVVVGGLVALLAARRLWRGSRTVAVAWVAVVGSACLLMAAASGNILHAARVVVFEAGMTSFRWPVLGVQPATFTEGPYYYRLDEVMFWMPGIGVVVALLLACLLLTGWVADRGRGATTG
jgi:hypothetical protein